MKKSLPTQFKKPENAAILKIVSGTNSGKQFRLLGDRILIGRSGDCDIILKDNEKCSRQHALIKFYQNSYSIESLNLKNLVLVNKKTVTNHILSEKDLITIGSLNFQFFSKKPPVAMSSHFSNSTKKKAKKSSFTKHVFIALLGLVLFIVFSENESTEQKRSLSVATEQEIDNEIEALEILNKQEALDKRQSEESMLARVALIKGLRDFNKGYYYRALKAFDHCTTLSQKNKLCKSYSRKSKAQVNRIIQKKMLLGKAYRDNNQYQACQATYKSIEVMIRNPRDSIFKEARQNRRFCNLQLQNRF